MNIPSAKAQYLVFLFAAFLFTGVSQGAIQNGELQLNPEKFVAGSSVDLNGKWLYCPGYSLSTSDKPESALPAGCVSVPVPQLLNRIYWWLDDSEDYKQWETARLKALGFDTDKAEDGWYYLKLNLQKVPEGKHLYLQFDGVAMISRAYCNGALLGEHEGMFSRFEYDLTPHLKTGANVIAVFDQMEKIPPTTLSMGEAVTVNLTASKVRSLSKGMFGPLSPGFPNKAYDLHGIWQPVRLAVSGAARLDDVWFVPSLDGAEVRVEARALGGNQDAKLSAKWTDLATGKLFAEIAPSTVQLGASATSHKLLLKDAQPKPWTPAKPNLYRLDVTLQATGGEVLDKWSHDVGFRTFEVRGNQFYLNGRPWWLRGADHLPYGKNPFDPSLARILIRHLHDANIRITRTHATPWNEAWLNAADNIGLAVSLEGIRPWALAGKIGATPPDMFASWLMENEDVVKRARNHPSVFIYTVGNEMLLRDTKNIEKWKQLSEVVRQTRKLDPTRPVICSSEYARDSETYNELIKPNGIDDGDADDLHRYNNWYGPSSFVADSKLEKEIKANGGVRPLMGQEMASGYPDLDTGLPVLRYTRDLLTPQAWVGNLAYPGKDPQYFLEHHRAVTKRWAETLRYERGTNTAGFMLFAAECWFSHSYDPRAVTPYPVLAAVKEAFAPVGLALETSRRRFFPGEKVETAIHITNDDEDEKDYAGLRLELAVMNSNASHAAVVNVEDLGVVRELGFHKTIRVPASFGIPKSGQRARFVLVFRLLEGNRLVSTSSEYVDVIPPAGGQDLDAPLYSRTLGPEMTRFLKDTFHLKPSNGPADSRILLLGKGDSLGGLQAGGALRSAVEKGATLIALSPGEALTALFPADILNVKAAPGEFGDFSPCAGSPLARGLGPMDLKWWGRKNDWRVFVADTSHRLKEGSMARELVRYIPPHSYISADKLPEQYRTVLFEIRLGKGRIWACDLDLEDSVSVDPSARQMAANLLMAAADTDSTSQLPAVLSHQTLLEGRNGQPK